MLDVKSLDALSYAQIAARRSYLPQNPYLEWPISVERLVALGLTPRLPATGKLPESFAPAIARALEACDLTARRDQPATTLSGGEFARATLARAIVSEPQILIVDEPITGLDPLHAIHSMKLLSAFARGGTLVIASLHDLDSGGALCQPGDCCCGWRGPQRHGFTQQKILSTGPSGCAPSPRARGDLRGFTLLSPSEK